MNMSSKLTVHDMVPAPKAPRMRGTVMATLPSRGYFWILGEDGMKYFAHGAKIREGCRLYDIREGQKCIFTPVDSDPRGFAAIAIDLLDSVE